MSVSKEFHFSKVYYSWVICPSESFESLLNYPINSRERTTLPEQLKKGRKMGQKDLTEKNLEFYPDVFADILNVLLYQGEQVVSAEELQPAPTETLYMGKEDKLHNQFHDVSKYVVHGGCIRMQYTLENQSRGERSMVLRKAGHEGAVYREQIERKDTYPVISCTLHWGKTCWRQPRSLMQLWKKDYIPEVARKYIDNIKLQVFDMAHLPGKIRKYFKSDMRIIVDYLAEGKDYIPTRQHIVHIKALLMMLRELTEDERYEAIIEEMLDVERRKGAATMCELLDKYEKRGIEKGIEKGIMDSLQNLMETMKMNLEQAMDALKIPDAEKNKYRESNVK